MSSLHFKLYKFQALLADGEGLRPKTVGGNIMCTFLTCLLCAISWFCNNKKYTILHVIKNYQNNFSQSMHLQVLPTCHLPNLHCQDRHYWRDSTNTNKYIIYRIASTNGSLALSKSCYSCAVSRAVRLFITVRFKWQKFQAA